MLLSSKEEMDFVDTSPISNGKGFGAEDWGHPFSKSTLVTFEIFRDEYWPHFPQSLTKGLGTIGCPYYLFIDRARSLTTHTHPDLSLVFSEFMGVIKGSEGVLTSRECHLDRRSYEDLSERSQYAFSHQRAVVYALFEAYTKRKKLEGHFDSADR